MFISNFCSFVIAKYLCLTSKTPSYQYKDKTVLHIRQRITNKLIHMQSTLNTELLASTIKSKRGKMGLRDAANEIGNVSSATLGRVEKGNLPDVETFIKICKWLQVSTDTFVIDKKITNTKLSEKDKIVYQLRSSQELDKDTITAMIAMVDMAFTKLKKNAK